MSGTTDGGGTPWHGSWRGRLDFEAMADALPALIFVCDASGSCVFANAEVQAATGLTEESWLGGGWISAIHPDDRVPAARAWGRAITAGEPFELEYRIKTVLGDYDWYLVRARPVRDGRRIVSWIGHATDIDDRRREVEVHAARLTAEAERQEAERRQTEEFAARLIDANADSIKTLSLDGRLLSINEAGAAALEMEADEVVLGQTWIGAWPTAEGRALAQNAVRDAARGGTGRFTAPWIPASGERQWWNVAITPMRDASGEVQSLLCVSRDVTEGRSARERLELITSTVEEGFYQYDWANSRLLYASPAYETIWGQPAEAFREDDAAYRRAIHPDDFDGLLEAWARLGIGESRRIEYRILRPDGQVRWVRDLAYPILDDHGRVTQVVGSVEDITKAKEDEAFFRIIANTVREGFYLFDVATGEMVYNSPGLEAIWGRSFSSAPHEPFAFLDWVHPEDRDLLIQKTEEGRQGRPTRTTFRVLRPDGSVRHLRDLCSPIVDAAGRVRQVVGCVEDLTETLKTEEQIRLITETVQEGFYQTDIATGRSLYSSPGCARILGRSPEVLEEDPTAYLDWVYPEDRPLVEGAMERERRGEPNRTVYRIVRPDGEVRWVRDLNHPLFDERGQPVQVVGSFEDITEVMEAEARAEAASQERYRSVFDLAAVGIARVTLDGWIIEANRRFAEVLGWPLDDLMGHPATELAHPDDLGPAYERTVELIQGQRSSFSMSLRYRTARDTWIWAQLTVSLAYDGEGKPLHLVSVIAPLDAAELSPSGLAA